MLVFIHVTRVCVPDSSTCDLHSHSYNHTNELMSHALESERLRQRCLYNLSEVLECRFILRVLYVDFKLPYQEQQADNDKVATLLLTPLSGLRETTRHIISRRVTTAKYRRVY